MYIRFSGGSNGCRCGLLFSVFKIQKNTGGVGWEGFAMSLFKIVMFVVFFLIKSLSFEENYCF